MVKENDYQNIEDTDVLVFIHSDYRVIHEHDNIGNSMVGWTHLSKEIHSRI
jgi:hypothetical protein